MRLRNLTYLLAGVAIAAVTADLWVPGYRQYGNPLQPLITKVEPHFQQWKEQGQQFVAQCDGQTQATHWGVNAETWAALKQKADLSPKDIQEMLGEPLCQLNGALVYPTEFIQDGSIHFTIDANGIRYELQRDSSPSN